MHEKTTVLQLPDAALMPSPHLSSSEHTLQFMLFQTSGLLTLLVLEKTVLNSFNSELLISFNLVKIFGFIYLRRCCLVHVNFESFSLELLFFLIEALTVDILMLIFLLYVLGDATFPGMCIYSSVWFSCQLPSARSSMLYECWL